MMAARTRARWATVGGLKEAGRMPSLSFERKIPPGAFRRSIREGLLRRLRCPRLRSMSSCSSFSFGGFIFCQDIMKEPEALLCRLSFDLAAIPPEALPSKHASLAITESHEDQTHRRPRGPPSRACHTRGGEPKGGMKGFPDPLRHPLCDLWAHRSEPLDDRGRNEEVVCLRPEAVGEDSSLNIV